MISALSELAIPHFTSASIFAAAEAKQRHVFDRNLKHLLVRAYLLNRYHCSTNSWHSARGGTAPHGLCED